MSSIRLFILSSFAEHGPMHGHLLRLVAERMRVPLWTDISVGAVYGAMKRLAAEGLLREAGREQEGNRPTRQLYEITEEGRRALAALRREGLREVWFKFDPFDLALTRMDRDALETLPRFWPIAWTGRGRCLRKADGSMRNCATMSAWPSNGRFVTPNIGSRRKSLTSPIS